MREITQEVLDGSYDKPLGRGVLDWRILELSPMETKHIVEVGRWRVYLKRHRIQETALLVSIDRFGDVDEPLLLLPDVLDVNAVFAYSKTTNDEELKKIGFELHAVKYIVPPRDGVRPPPKMVENCLLTDEESKSFKEAASNIESMRKAAEAYGMGTAAFHRVDFGDGRTAVALIDVVDGHAELLTHWASDFQSQMVIADMFDYIASGQKDGGSYAVNRATFDDPTPLVQTLETLNTQTRGVYIILKGVSNAN
ncbi:hypothetical protein pEaSNUABM6_00123 [Erwinia phage pEa_SNUABM_6]|nr:hypothetical protein pEaSNUABM6_00123 [Erwinia phage pEa_SNUABM_6]